MEDAQFHKIFSDFNPLLYKVKAQDTYILQGPVTFLVLLLDENFLLVIDNEVFNLLNFVDHN